MSDETSGCKILITGIKDVDVEDLMLFFESQRYCPNGGEVEDFQKLKENEGVITFKDSEVIKRLESSLTLHDGTHISIRPYEEQLELSSSDSEDSKHADDSYHSCPEDDDREPSEPERIGEPAAECYAADRLDSKAKAEQVKFQSSWDIRDHPRGDSSDDLSGRMDLKHSRSHQNLYFEPSVKDDERELLEKQSKSPERELGEQGTEKRRTIGSARDASNILSSTGVESSHIRVSAGSECLQEDHKAQSNSEFSRFKETLRQDSHKVETLNCLNLGKFQLLKMIWEVGEKPVNQCVVRFNEETCSATIEGTSDSVDTVKLSLLVSSAEFESECVKVSPATLKVLQSIRGKDWMMAEFSPLAVLYIRDSKPHLMANNKMSLQSAVKRLHEIVASRTMPFLDIHEVFLQSSVWSQKVEALENSLLISVVKNESSREIEVGGRKYDIEKGMSEISDLLTKNEPKECIVKHQRGVVRLLEKNEKAIMNSIENCVNNASVSLSFQPQDHLIKINGLPDHVDSAARILDNYNSDILYEAVETNTPGLRKEQFDDHIDLLERRHDCVIEVRSKAGSKVAAVSEKNSQPSPVRRDIPKSSIKIMSGSITKFKADVVVNTIGDKRLEKGGIVCKQFLEAGAPDLEQELRKLNIPKDFGKDVVVTSAYGSIDAKFVLHAAVAKYRNDQSTEDRLPVDVIDTGTKSFNTCRLYNTIKMCLEMAMDKNATTIAFPTLGCGKLGFQPKDMIKCFLNAERDTKTSLKIFIIAFEEDLNTQIQKHLQEMTSSEARRSSEGQRNEVVKEKDTGESEVPVQTFQQSSDGVKVPGETTLTSIEVVSGSITKHKADIVVNTIGDKRLEKGGVVLKQFLEAGAPQMEQELRKLKIPEDFGKDVVITSAYGSIDAKFVLHAAIAKYRNKQSVERLYSTIKKCLEMAVEKNATTIAFPTLGCGKLGFTPEDMVKCFLQAEIDTKAKLKIFIVAFEEDLHKRIKSALQDIISHEDGHKLKVFGRETSNPSDGDSISSSGSGNNAIVFHINAMDKKKLSQIKKSLKEKIHDMTREESISDDVIAELDEEQLSSVSGLGTSDVHVKIDKNKNSILLKGEKMAVYDAKVRITDMLSSFHNINRCPVYWKRKNTEDAASGVTRQRVLLDPSSPLYSEVSEMVMKTWDQQKVGQGKDSKNLGTHAIKIVNIFFNISPLLWERYMVKRKQMSKAASQKRFHQLKDQNGEADIMTMTLGLQKLYKMLNREVNEVFLLHGTKSEALDVIEADGLDSRVCGRALFGFGCYFAESSTKADQYTDPTKQRANLGDPLHMYLCRVLLGSSYVCSIPKNVENFKRPPCMRAGCHKDNCLDQERYDSVVGTHIDQRRLNFREFVVYHPDQSYPDFLIEYQRVKCA